MGFLVSEDLLVLSVSPVRELVEANGEGVSILRVDLGVEFSLLFEEFLSELEFFDSAVVLSEFGHILCEVGALDEEAGGWGFE